MSKRFTTLVRSYAGQLLLLTRRLYRCSPSSLIYGIPVFVANQVSLVLALLLPLKVIIMLGSDGVPRYFRSFMSEATRESWMLGLAGAAVGMFLLHLVTARLLTRLANRGGGGVLDQSQKTVLFDDQQEFASDIFGRVIATWGTIGMALGGLSLGLLLEWRLVLLVVAAIMLEFALFALYWNRFSAPERSTERERLVANRTSVLQNLSAVNVLLLFGGLVYLLLTDPAMNFIVAVLLFLLTRQVLARSARIFPDANFFVRNRARVDALVHPGRHLREKRSTDRDRFEYLLIPERRGRVFQSVARASGSPVADREWQWRDTFGKRGALFVSSASESRDSEYRLKLTVRHGDAGLARELLADQSLMATFSDWVRTSEELVFGTWRMPSSWLGWVHRNTSSLMFRRAVHERLGYWDEVNCNADVEFVDRLTAVWGSLAARAVVPGIPMAFARLDSSSLTQRSKTNVISSLKGLRHDYAGAYSAWHANARKADDLYLPSSPRERPFPAPAGMLMSEEN